MVLLPFRSGLKPEAANICLRWGNHMLKAKSLFILLFMQLILKNLYSLLRPPIYFSNSC